MIALTNYEKLEKERINKIRNLSLDEVKAYIDNLNKNIFKSFEANNPEDVEHYQKKLSEVFDITKDKWINLDFYSLSKKCDITTSKLIESNTRKQIIFITLTSQLLLHSNIVLNELFALLNYVLMIYYHNYYFREASIVEDLLIKLEIEYNFKDDEFSDYANSIVDKYNETLMKELNFLIARMKDTINHVIALSDCHVDDNFEETIASVLKEIEFEKQYVIKKSASDDGIKTLKDGDYLDLLESLKECYEDFNKTCKFYSQIRDKIMNLINLDDGFADLKERDYDISNKLLKDNIFTKEDFIAMRPSYDMKKCEFVESRI